MTEVLALPAPVALLGIHVDQVNFYVPVSLSHVFRLAKRKPTCKPIPFSRAVRRSVSLFLLQLIPLVVDQLEKYIVHLLRMDEGKFTVPERPGFLSSRSGDERVSFRFQLLYGSSVLSTLKLMIITPSPFFSIHFATGPSGVVDSMTRSHFAQPVPCDADLFGLIGIGIVGFHFPYDGLPYLPRPIQVLHCDAYMVYLVDLHRFPLSMRV